MATKKQKIEDVKNEKNLVAANDFSNVFAVKNPWVSEKAYSLSQLGQYVFLVNPQTNKNEVKKAVKVIYKVDPISVNIVNLPGKSKKFGQIKGKKSGYKKAIVKLKEGQKIDIMPA